MTRLRYQSMVVGSYEVQWQYNLLASVSSWILLAAFLVLPGTFTSLDKLGVKAAGNVIHVVAQPTPLICISAVLCLSGLLSTIFLWISFRRNYVWLLSHIFL